MFGWPGQDSQLSGFLLQHASHAGMPAAVLVQASQVPAVLDNCLPDPVASLGVGVGLAVLIMLVVAALVWALASLPAPPSLSLPLRPTTASPLLAGRRLRLDTLDGLRTVLVMYIVIYHVRWALPPLLAPWFQTGHWAVQFFFVLSGFVAATCHEASGGEQPIDMHGARTMALRRITRLCPPYFVALLGVAAVVAFRGGGEPFLAWPVQALLLQSLMPVRVCGPLDAGHWSQNFLPFSANGEGWFVSAILITSLCFPLLYNARPRGGFHTTLSALLLVVVARSVPTFLTMSGWCPMDTYTFAPVRLLEFAAGMLAAQLYREMPAWAAECGGWHWVFDASLLSAVPPVWFLGHWHRWAVCENNHGDYFLTAIFCLTCIAARGLAGQQSKSQWDESLSPLSGLLSSKALVAPAVYSYQAYIFQEVFLALLSQCERPVILQYWWVPVPLTWAAAVLSVHALEEPLRRPIEARLAAASQVSLSKSRQTESGLACCLLEKAS